MEKLTTGRKLWLASGLALLGIMLIVAQTSGISLGGFIGAAANPESGAITVATVNGESINLRALEMTRAVIQGTSTTALTSREAYQKALNHQIREAMVRQEARHRGLSVTQQEAEDLLKQNKAMAEQSPQLKKQLEDQAKAMGLSGQDFDAQAVEAYKEGLLGTKLYEALSKEIPPPTEAEIDLYLTRQPGPNALVLIPITFDDVNKANQVYRELQGLQAAQDADQFTTTFDDYARQIGHKQTGEFVHRTFHFAMKSELPDYAQDAIGKQEHSIALFTREDGSAIIYLVLKSISASTTEARANARQIVAQEKAATYADEYIDRLVSQAQVHIFYDRLPPEARPS